MDEEENFILVVIGAVTGKLLVEWHSILGIEEVELQRLTATLDPLYLTLVSGYHAIHIGLIKRKAAIV